jgi:hypothetical protein
MNEIPQTKRGKGTYVDQSEHVPRTLATIRRRQQAVAIRLGKYSLDDRLRI